MIAEDESKSEMPFCSPINSGELEQLIRLACGLPSRNDDRSTRQGEGSAGHDDEPSSRREQSARLVRLAIDLLVTTRQSGFSPSESGCFFLLLAAHLLDDMPLDTIVAMIEQIRGRAG